MANRGRYIARRRDGREKKTTYIDAYGEIAGTKAQPLLGMCVRDGCAR